MHVPVIQFRLPVTCTTVRVFICSAGPTVIASYHIIVHLLSGLSFTRLVQPSSPHNATTHLHAVRWYERCRSPCFLPPPSSHNTIHSVPIERSFRSANCFARFLLIGTQRNSASDELSIHQCVVDQPCRISSALIDQARATPRPT